MSFLANQRNQLHRGIIAYWDEFYSADETVPTKESDFARWVTAQVPNVDCLIEFGCGTGRDSVWFTNTGIGVVVATDASKPGLAILRGRVHNTDCTNLRIMDVDLNSPISLAELSRQFNALAASRILYARTVFYGRFLLHAIDESAQSALIEFAVAHLRTGDSLALEYRASNLGGGRYVFGNHYRRPIDAEKLGAQCLTAGFSAVRTTTSDSFAGLHGERPLIGRTLAVR